VAYCALKLGRKAVSVELSELYHREAVRYAEDAVRQRKGPSLLDWLEMQDARPAQTDESEPSITATEEECV